MHAAEAAGEAAAIEEGAELSGDESGQRAVPVIGLNAGEEGLEVAGDQHRAVRSGRLAVRGSRCATRPGAAGGGRGDEGERGQGGI